MLKISLKLTRRNLCEFSLLLTTGFYSSLLKHHRGEGTLRCAFVWCRERVFDMGPQKVFRDVVFGLFLSQDPGFGSKKGTRFRIAIFRVRFFCRWGGT